MITPQLRGVTVGWDSKRIQSVFYFDGRVSEPEQEIASEVETEVLAAFPDQEVEVRATRLDAPQRLNEKTLAAWVYRRRE